MAQALLEEEDYTQTACMREKKKNPQGKEERRKGPEGKEKPQGKEERGPVQLFKQ